LNQDPTAAERKKDHIEMALSSQVLSADDRFYYEPILASHDKGLNDLPKDFLNNSFDLPIWVSSMTGGTEWAKIINTNIAKACEEFGMGMGLGSCRSLLENDDRLEDFNVRKHIGNQPLYANLGIAQVEELVFNNNYKVIQEMLSKLEANGLIIHVNPMQEIAQPEGDIIKYSPLETISKVLEKLDTNIIVKEVGQGMGYRSLEALLRLPLAAIEFAAHGGTNFTKLELMRSTDTASLDPLTLVGHNANEMVEMTNQLVEEMGEKVKCQELIISGGVKDFLDGYYLIKKSSLNAIYGQAGAFLRHARGDYEQLQKFVLNQRTGLQMAFAYLHLK